jgi:molecular chaperone HtpG
LPSFPFIETLKEKGSEVLYVVDPLDKHAVQQLKEVDGKKTKPVTKRRVGCAEVKRV